jgi:K+-transporting ATPase ATPase C chain
VLAAMRLVYKETIMIPTLRPLLVVFGALTLVVAVLYPLTETGIGQVAYAGQAEASLLARAGNTVGSRRIGQAVTSSTYFWGRPSASAPMPNNGALVDAVKRRIAALQALDPSNKAPIPVDLVTASASGLDPEISLAGARYQTARVAAARNLPLARVEALVRAHTLELGSGFLGEARVNVLALNLALDVEPASKR